jgi:hypothetical protein
MVVDIDQGKSIIPEHCGASFMAQNSHRVIALMQNALHTCAS